MKKKFSRGIRIALTAVLFAGSFLAGVLAASPPSMEEEVYFSPKGGCTKAVIDNLNWAEKYVRVQAYSFTSTPIAEALIRARQRGVDVRVLLDKSQLRGKGSKIEMLAQAGVPVMIDTKHAIAHNKVMIIDGVTVLTGSFNFTTAAEDKNAENLLVIRDKKIAKQYRDNWNKHYAHSTPYDNGPFPGSATITFRAERM